MDERLLPELSAAIQEMRDLNDAREIAPVAPPRKIIQLVVSRTSLIALTDQSEIWVLHGFDSVAAGGGGYPPEIKWRLLGVTLPPTNDGVETLPRW